MNKIIYLNRNLQTRDVDLEDLERFKGHLFIEDAFVICVIINGFPVTGFLKDLTALERYAMSSNGFDYLSLQDKDFRLSNTFFRLSYSDVDLIEGYIQRTYLGENPNVDNPAPAPASVSFPAMVPVHKYENDSTKVIKIMNTNEIDEITAQIIDGYDLMKFFSNNNNAFAYNKVSNIGGLFIVVTNEFPDFYALCINPKTNEYYFENGQDWRQLHDAEIAYWGVKKGYAVVWRNVSNGTTVMLSTTPIYDNVLDGFGSAK